MTRLATRPIRHAVPMLNSTSLRCADSTFRRLLLPSMIALALILPLSALAESVTYKGSLQDGGKPANGSFDLRVQLYSAEVGGVSIGEAITLHGVSVENGRFNVPVELAQPLPKDASVWLEAQLQAPGRRGFQPLQGRQEIKSVAGGVCWEVGGNTGVGGGNVTLGVTDTSSSAVAVTNSNSFLYVRRDGGIEQNNSFASAPFSVAWGNVAVAGASNSFAAGRGNIAVGHTFTTVFGDGGVSPFSSTAANQFLIRALNGVAINTNAPLGTFTVRRGGSSGVAAPAGSSITAESDASNYLSLLSPATTTERGILFGDTSSAANGGIIFNSVGAGITNPNGLTFRTGGNLDRLKLTSSGALLLNLQSDSELADVSFRSGTANPDFQLSLRSVSDKLARLSVADVNGNFFVESQLGDLLLWTNTAGKYIHTNDRFGILRRPTTNELEVAGNASKDTAGAWLANSDRRIKQDVQPLDDALATIRQIQPVSFRYTDEYRAAHPKIGTERYYNVIAQDFAKVFPDAVRSSGEHLPGAAKSRDTEILQVDTYPASITAIAAIQELDVVNSVQDRQLAELTRENQALREQLQALERLVRAAR